MTRKILILTGILVVIISIGLMIGFFFIHKPDQSLINYVTTQAKIGNKIYTLYVADTPQSQEQGLSGVKNLREDEGMIFRFKSAGIYYFWMKDMLFPIDFVFVNNNRVIDTLQSITPASYPKTFTAVEPFDLVIELKDRQTTFGQIKKGSIVEYIK